MRRPKTVAAVLAGGTLVLGVGSAVAASLPSWTTRPASASGPSAAGTSSRAAGAPEASPAPSVTVPAHATRSVRHSAASVRHSAAARIGPTASKSQRAQSITYVVKQGDTLSGIARWFKLHGYGSLYAANKAVIGANPNLIIPGERITIAHGVMTLSGAR